MADYNFVTIGSLYLTDTGLIGGQPCRTEVAGLDALQFDFTGANTSAADGTVFSHIVANEGKGLPIEIRPFVMTKTVFDAIINEIQTAHDANLAINITVSGDTGDFDLDCIPALPKPVEMPGSFSDGQIDGVVFRFLVDTVN